MCATHPDGWAGGVQCAPVAHTALRTRGWVRVGWGVACVKEHKENVAERQCMRCSKCGVCVCGGGGQTACRYTSGVTAWTVTSSLLPASAPTQLPPLPPRPPSPPPRQSTHHDVHVKEEERIALLGFDADAPRTGAGRQALGGLQGQRERGAEEE